MNCERIQMTLSERLDGVRVDDDLLDRHVARCADCQAFLAGARQARRELRLSPLDDDIPEITASVIDRLPAASGRRRLPDLGWRTTAPVAASLIVGLLVGALLATTSARQPSLALQLSDQVLAAQHAIAGFDADVTIEEYGWHRVVPVRRYEGVLHWAAPERLLIDLEDQTVYPDESWRANDVTRVVTTRAEWSTALPACPRSLLPGCLPDGPRTTGVAGRVPLAGLGALALDAVIPVQSFALGGGIDLGTRSADGGQQVGVVADAAQVAPLLEALVGEGNWRGFHPSDPVELWVDATAFTPREVIVRAARGSLRDQWAAERELTDRPGEVLLRVLVTPRDGRDDVEMPTPPGGLRSAAFVDGDVDLPEPASLPQGMQEHRRGTQVTSEFDVATITWTDGRAWLRLRGVQEWSGGRLFGDVGTLVRRVTLPDGRIIYASGSGHAVAIHTDGVDLLLEGTVHPDVLAATAASIPVTGLRVPADWAEAADRSLADAADELAGLLIPSQMDGFGPPAVRVADEQVVIGYAGSGGRELVLTQRRGDAVSPPIVLDVIGLQVRGRPARYLPDSGELEWVEGGLVVSLRSDDLALVELLRIAADLQVLS